MMQTQKIEWAPFSQKHKTYIKRALDNRLNVAEGAIRSGKTIDHCIIAAAYLEKCPDMIHLASGSTIANAKLNIGVCNGFGLEALFRGRCHWGKYRDNEALFLRAQTGEKIIVFAGGGKADSYKKILGNSYGLWIATEINEHYDSEDSRTSFIKVAMGRQIAARWPLMLWDLNPCNPAHAIYRDYIDKHKAGFPGGYQYQHFVLGDNASISADRRAEIEMQYKPGSVWYRRDILGERCVAEGLIYQEFADNPAGFIKDAPADVRFGTIGVDFGGNGSAHAFVCTGFTSGFKQMGALDEYYLKKIITPTRLETDFIDFVRRCQSRWKVADAYCDSAEQTLIQGLRTACARAKVPLSIHNARKGPINDRIRFYSRLMSSGRYFVTPQCPRLAEAFSSAVWDPKKLTEDLRLDDGSYNVDSLDAAEYSTEPFMSAVTGIS